MIRAGFTDAALDEEARQLVATAETVRAAEGGTQAVLLLSAQAELEAVQSKLEAVQSEVVRLRQRVVELERTTDAGAPDTAACHGDCEGGVLLLPAAPPANGTAAEAGEGGNSDGCTGVLDTTERDIAPLAEQIERSAVSRGDEEGCQSDGGAAASSPMPPPTESGCSIAASAERSQQQQQQQPQQKQPGSPARPFTPPAPTPHLATSDVSAVMLSRYKELALALEERCRAAERSSSLSAARCASLEETLGAAQAALAAAQQRGAAAAATARAQIVQLEERLRGAEAAAAQAAASAVPAPSAAAAAAAAQEQLAMHQQQLASCRVQLANLERRLAASEARESGLLGELRKAEAAAAERDAAAAAAATLREQLAELNRESSHLRHQKQVGAQATRLSGTCLAHDWHCGGMVKWPQRGGVVKWPQRGGGEGAPIAHRCLCGQHLSVPSAALPRSSPTPAALTPQSSSPRPPCTQTHTHTAPVVSAQYSF